MKATINKIIDTKKENQKFRQAGQTHQKAKQKRSGALEYDRHSKRR